MATELGRVALAVGVGVLIPLVAGVRGVLAATAVTVAIAAWGCARLLDRIEGWAIVIAAVAVTAVACSAAGWRRAAWAGLGVAAVEVAAIALLGWDYGWRAIGHTLGDTGLLIVSSAALVAVFGGGALIGAILRPLTEELRPTTDEVQTLVHTGLYIGWLERALLFGFIVAGAPGAAAVVVGLKSVARFPSFEKERFAEYYLIGTLSSVLIAAAAAVGTRALLGLGPLVT